MKLALNAKTLAVVAAAFAGLSLSSAYAAPQYTPGPESPLDATSLNSVSPLLNNFNDYISVIDAKLASGSLAVPGTPVLDVDFFNAVNAAILDDTAHAEQIVSAAVQYRPNKTKALLTAVAKANPTLAVAIVTGAANANPTKAGDVAAGAILGLIQAAGGSPDTVDLADAADATVIAETRERIESVAKSALAATKTATNQLASAVAVAESLMAGFLAETNVSNAELFIDDIGRGALNGVNNFASTTKSAVASAMLAKFVGTGAATGENVVNFAMGALKGTALVTGDSGFDQVALSLAGNATLNGAITGLADAVAAGAKGQKAIRQALSGTDLAAFNTSLTSDIDTELELYAYTSGAVQALKSRGAAYVAAAFTDPDVTYTGDTKQRAIVSAAVTSNFTATSKVVTAAITSGPNSLTPVAAVETAIAASTDLYSGAATTAAIKTIAVGSPNEGTNAVAVLTAALEAAEDAGYSRAFADIASSAAKAKKLFDNDIVTAAINTVPTGWEEAVAAFIIAGNPKESTATGVPTAGSNKEAAISAANSKVGANVDSFAQDTVRRRH
jgi:hypothetical protein